MRRALALAASSDAPRGVNPRVGCVILDVDGHEVGAGHHRGAGTPHAEVDALAQAGSAARGGTAVVTLEPCRHTGRTGPCTQALIDAGIIRIVYAMADPTAVAGGGAEILRAAGLDVVAGVCASDAVALNRLWLHVQRTGRPYVIWKCAVSLDGRVADASGGPTRLTGPQANAFVHDLRGEVDAIMVGASTARIDDPHLTARHPDGALRDRQPLRVVVGERAPVAQARLRDDAAPTLHLATRELAIVWAELVACGVQSVLLEGGPTLAGACLAAEAVDEIIWLIAPRLLGAGPLATGALPGAWAVDVREIRALGDDVAVLGVPVRR